MRLSTVAAPGKLHVDTEEDGFSQHCVPGGVCPVQAAHGLADARMAREAAVAQVDRVHRAFGVQLPAVLASNEPQPQGRDSTTRTAFAADSAWVGEVRAAAYYGLGSGWGLSTDCCWFRDSPDLPDSSLPGLPAQDTQEWARGAIPAVSVWSNVYAP